MQFIPVPAKIEVDSNGKNTVYYSEDDVEYLLDEILRLKELLAFGEDES